MISVIIPVYNGERYIRGCLDSLEPGRYPELEIIAVNDGSKDGSYALLSEYAERFPNVKVIDKVNQGAAQARKTGIEQATGDYIAFLDIDDWVSSGLYEKAEAVALEKNADIVVFDYMEEYPTRQVPVKNRFKDKQTFPLRGEDAIRYMHQRSAIFSFPWNKIYRAELLKSVEFPMGNFVGEDYNMLLQLFGKTDKIEYLDMIGYHYVLTENSASRTGYGPNTLLAYENYKKDYQMICSAYPEMKREITNYLIVEYMAFIVAMGRNSTYDKSLIKAVKRFIRRGFFGFVFASYVPLKMKGSAIALCISYRLLIAMYRMLA